MTSKLSFIAAIVLSGCTVVPAPVSSSVGSVSGNDASGPITVGGGAWSVNAGDLARYNALIARYGNKFLLPLHKGDGCTPDQARAGRTIIDQEHMIDFGQMAGWYREGRK